MRPSLDWLLAAVPLVFVLRYAGAPESWIFFAAAIAIVPLAKWLGEATEQLACRAGEGVGGLLNATFGNAAELIIAGFALKEGLRDVVKASLTGSIIGNLLLVLGASALAGGVRFRTQRFNESAARTQATMLTLAAIALIIPAAFHHFVGPRAGGLENDLSLEISVVLLVTYGLGLLFSLHTHRRLFSSPPETSTGRQPEWSARKAIAVLAGSTALIAAISELLVKSVGAAAQSLGMTSLFVGVIVVGVIGNAAEHSTAVIAARANKMDLSVAIAIGSTIQIALFVAPVLVIASRFAGSGPMDLVFTTPEILAIGLGIWIAGQIAGDGETNWLEGVQLLAVYTVLAMTFYFLPEGGTR